MSTLLTSNIFGRTLTLINRTGRILGVMGRTVPASGSLDVAFAHVQGNNTYMAQLNKLGSEGLLSLQLDGVALSNESLLTLDANLPGSVLLTREVFTNLAAADPNAFKIAFLAPAVATVYAGSDFDGATGAYGLHPPRNVTITGTTGGGEALEAKTATVTGLCIDGSIKSETIALTILGAGATVTDAGALAFTKLVSVSIPGDASGSPGDYEFGFGDIIGLARMLSTGMLTKLFADNVAEAAAATVLSGVSGPNGTFSPTTSPNGAVDFVVCYVTE